MPIIHIEFSVNFANSILKLFLLIQSFVSCLDVLQGRGGTSLSIYRHHRQGSISSDRQSVHSILTASLTLDAGASTLSPQQLGTMGEKIFIN